MKDWHKLEPDVVRLMNKHYNVGRAGHRIDKVVVHHNAGVLTVDQIWQVWQTRQASAHYQVESGGRIGQLVYDDNTAWHAANSLANRTSIGIEISNSGGAAQDWPVAQKAIEEAGKLIGAVCYVKKLGRPRHGVNVFDHRRWTNTSCPHHLAAGGKYHNQLMGHAVAHYDWMVANAPGTKPAPTPAPTSPKETTMSDPKIALILDQLAGHPGDKFPGWPQLGGRTLVDAVAAIGAHLEIDGFTDTKKGK